MKRIKEFLRAVFISPEIFVGSLPFAISSYWTEPATFVAQQLTSDTKWALAAFPLGMLGTTYAFGSEILSPAGAKKVLLEWPDYWRLKLRILVALGFCVLGFVLVVSGAYMIQRENAAWGATTTVSGLLSAASALATVAYAKWSIREILPD